jgi:hypothetical protein
MKKGTKNAMIMAALCTAAGLCLTAIALVCAGLQIKDINGMKRQEETYTVQESFFDIDINVVTADVHILPSDNGACRVECRETDKITHTVTVVGNTLTVRQQDSRRWFERLDWFGSYMLEVLVYLPKETYDGLTVTTVSGNIDIGKELGFGNAALHSTSGDIDSTARVSGDLTATTTSGHITLSQHTGGHLLAKTTSGRIVLSDIEAASITASTTSGGISGDKLKAAGTLRISCVSGGISLTNADGKQVSLSTVSGNVSVSLLSKKTFSYKTVSGHVQLASSTVGADVCHIETTSGNIYATVVGVIP